MKFALGCGGLSKASMWCFTGRKPEGVLISRILHQRMLPENQAIDDEDDTPKRP
jgi:hypothetical protein